MTTPVNPGGWPTATGGTTPVTRSGDDRRQPTTATPAKKAAPKAPTVGKAPSPAPRSPASADRAQQVAAAPAGSQISQILDFGMGFRGTPYQWGGAAPGGFDCSGLLYYMFGKAGVKIPRTSGEQARAGVGVAPKDARPGDLIALDMGSRKSGNSNVDHIGVYLGNGMMLVAPKTGDVVKVQKIDLSKAAAIRRVMPESAYQSMRQSNGTYLYANAQGVKVSGTVTPRSGGAAVGGGDPGSNPQAVGTGMSAAAAVTGAVDLGGAPDVFGPDGKIDPVKAMQTYGYIYELANSVPELKKVLSDAITGGWSADRFAAQVQTTKWWKTTNDNQRRVLELQKTNPGEYARQRQLKIDEIVIAARNLGVPQDNKKIAALADKALSLGWSDQEISRFVAADVKVQAAGNTGATAVTVDALKKAAEEYGVPMSLQTLQTWTTQMLRGMVPEGTFESYLKEQAKSLFPGLSAAIDAGVTVAQYTAPYRELTAEILELNPADLRLDNPHMQKALYAHGKDGSRTQMTLSEYREYLRGTDGFRKTRQAQETAAGFVNSITEMFGATA